MPHSTLIDPHNRRLNYLRVSITDRCNLKCLYCMPGDRIPKLSHKEILRYEEILRIVEVGVRLGISKIRITGGEPLFRRGVYAFLETLGKMPGIQDLSLTTNGVLLKENIERIRSAGIKRINVSLDTLKREQFRQITGYDFFDQVWEGIETALKMGFDPIKLNVVPLRGINDDELEEIAALSFAHPLHVRFIEYMPMGISPMEADRQLLAHEIRQRIQKLGELVPVEKQTNDGPAERFRLAGGKGEIGFIRPISRHFCRTCNRLRLTASGRLRPCLLSDHAEDIKTPLREGCSDDDLAEIFLKAVRSKPSEHHLADRHPGKISTQMCTIGG